MLPTKAIWRPKFDFLTQLLRAQAHMVGRDSWRSYLSKWFSVPATAIAGRWKGTGFSAKVEGSSPLLRLPDVLLGGKPKNEAYEGYRFWDA